MIIKEISFPTAQENIFYDQSMLESAEDGTSGEALRFWEAEKFFIVLGRTSRLEDDINVAEAHKDGVEIIRRNSGGGTVLQGPGCLNYSLILSYERNPLLKNIRKSYEIILGGICQAFNGINIEASFEPISDMVIGGRKFSGNAQARRRRYMLHHGTILYNFPLEKIERYLTIPKEQPPYRKGRTHSDFLINVGTDPHRIKQQIRDVYRPKAESVSNAKGRRLPTQSGKCLGSK